MLQMFHVQANLPPCCGI